MACGTCGKGREAYLYRFLGNKAVKCCLCAHRCYIRLGERGICGVRENREGVLCTYTELTVFFEYAYDTAKLARVEYRVETISLQGKICTRCG